MNEQEVRALVREAIERHLGRHAVDNSQLRIANSTHPSHTFLAVVPGSAADDGMCVIEPRVRCNHCGFCQSYGH